MYASTVARWKAEGRNRATAKGLNGSRFEVWTAADALPPISAAMSGGTPPALASSKNFLNFQKRDSAPSSVLVSVGSKMNSSQRLASSKR